MPGSTRPARVSMRWLWGAHARRSAASIKAPGGDHNPLLREHKSAFDSYIRCGETGGLKQLETKALSAGSGPDGGYLAPPQVESEVLRRLSALSPIRAIAGNRVISGGLYKVAHSVSGPASGWVSETAARPETDSPTLAELSFPAMELYSMPAATQTLLDDAIVDIDQWIADEVETAFAEQEGAAFVNGDGNAKPRGFLDYTAVADGSWSWGNLGFIGTGVADAFPASDPSDVLVDLIYALKAGYRQNATFVDESQDAKRDPQVQGSAGQLSVAAAGGNGAQRDLDELPT